MKNLIDDRENLLLERAMDLTAQRARLLSQNIANVDTPNYKRADLNFNAIFEAALAKDDLSLARTDPKHIAGTASSWSLPPVERETGTSGRVDGNNVDVESEMAKIAENTTFYQSLTSLWKRKMARLKSVIEGKG